MKKKNDSALKEWAVYTDLLGTGEFICLLKNIARASHAPDATTGQHEFFLFPTWDSMQPDDIKPKWQARYQAVAANPSEGMVKFQHYARVRAVARLTRPELLDRIEDLHPFTAEAARARYEQQPVGIDLLVLRVYRLRRPLLLVDRPMYDGTQSWVKLEAELSTRGCDPIMSRADFELRVEDVRERIHTLAVSATS